MKPFIKVCESKVLRRSVVVCCGTKDELKKLFFDPDGPFRNYDVKHSDHAVTWGFLEGQWEKVVGEEPDIGALGFATRFKGDVFLVLPKWNPCVFVHEAYHATRLMLREIGTDDEEFGAYIIEWLFESVCDQKGPKKRRKP